MSLQMSFQTINERHIFAAVSHVAEGLLIGSRLQCDIIKSPILHILQNRCYPTPLIETPNNTAHITLVFLTLAQLHLLKRTLSTQEFPNCAFWPPLSSSRTRCPAIFVFSRVVPKTKMITLSHVGIDLTFLYH